MIDPSVWPLVKEIVALLAKLWPISPQPKPQPPIIHTPTDEEFKLYGRRHRPKS